MLLNMLDIIIQSGSKKFLLKFARLPNYREYDRKEHDQKAKSIRNLFDLLYMRILIFTNSV